MCVAVIVVIENEMTQRSSGVVRVTSERLQRCTGGLGRECSAQ